MTVLDWIVVLIRWSHALGAVAWVGGGMFYLLVLRPALRRTPVAPEAVRSIGLEFRGLVHTGIAVLLVTGVILSASRLTQDTIGLAYVVVLSVKVVLALYLFYLARFLRQRAYSEENSATEGRWRRIRHHLTGTTAILILGVVIFGLADVLSALFESSLT
jgi:putative copper export protein